MSSEPHVEQIEDASAVTNIHLRGVRFVLLRQDQFYAHPNNKVHMSGLENMFMYSFWILVFFSDVLPQ
jgi:hypothetical protein